MAILKGNKLQNIVFSTLLLCFAIGIVEATSDIVSKSWKSIMLKAEPSKSVEMAQPNRSTPDIIDEDEGHDANDEDVDPNADDEEDKGTDAKCVYIDPDSAYSYHLLLEGLHNLILSRYPMASAPHVDRQYLENCHLYIDDGPYIEGSYEEIGETCDFVSFHVTTYNSDGTEKYVDYYEYIFPMLNNIVVYRNRFHGKGYHGGCGRIYVNDGDTRLTKRFFFQKDSFVIGLESLIKGVRIVSED